MKLNSLSHPYLLSSVIDILSCSKFLFGVRFSIIFKLTNTCNILVEASDAADVGMSDLSSYLMSCFSDAGIPETEAANYAIIFIDNRITQDMLLDLSKEYLKDMSINVLGDVISILKHAKKVHAQV